MKPAAFEYSRPGSVDEACALLAADDGARLIAGGQTLVPLMAMRLARPSRLIDIARIPGLSYIREELSARPRESGDPGATDEKADLSALGSRFRGNERRRGLDSSGTASSVAIGAATKQHIVEHDPLVRAKLPLLAKVMPYVGHGATRARGTVGGSLANGDPAAEIVLVAATLGATLRWREGGTNREIAAADFFIGPMLTALPQAACLTEARFPVWPDRRLGVGFHEVNARQSDFAFVAAAAQVALDTDGRCTRAAIGIGAATAIPLRLDTVATALQGQRFEEAKARDAVKAALENIESMEDLHASASYRRRVAVTLAIRAIADAYENAHAR
jgi:CO/xanthine dehydrogenase FAD-binding subunit